MLNALLMLLAATPGIYDPIFHSGFEAADTCPAGLQQLANISYVGMDGIRTNVDVTSWSNIWGHSSAFDTAVPWPGRPDSAPIFLNFGRLTYIAANFQVGNAPPAMFGWISHNEYNYGLDLTGAISTSCGDFSPAAQTCFTATISGQLIVPWRTNPGNFCHLAENEDYFLNLKITNPNASSATCAQASPTCVISTANNFTTTGGGG